MASSSIICPKCKNPISVDEALSHQIEDSLKLKYQDDLEKEKAQLNKVASEWQEKEKKKLEDKESQFKKDLEESLKKKFLEENGVEQKLLKEELEEKKKQLQESKDLELEFRKKQEAFVEREKNFELEKRRQLDAERVKIEENAQKHVREEYQMTIAEKDKVASDLLKQIEDLKQKATQGSQQLQGEVLELELEQLLKSEFPIDEILPVGKGVNGADVMQKIHDAMGRECGTLVWESKRTKNWDEKWIPKLKEDMRNAKGDLAILVTTVLPKDVSGFGPKDGIYVSDFENALAVAKILRIKVIELCHAKMSVEGKNDKKEILWNYLTGAEFKGRVEAIVEAFNLMREGLNKERQYFAKKWARDEKLIDTVVNQTIGMHGDLQGLMGASLPEIKSLELDNFEVVQITEVENTIEQVDSTIIERESTTTTNFVQAPVDDIVS